MQQLPAVSAAVTEAVGPVQLHPESSSTEVEELQAESPLQVQGKAHGEWVVAPKQAVVTVQMGVQVGGLSAAPVLIPVAEKGMSHLLLFPAQQGQGQWLCHWNQQRHCWWALLDQDCCQPCLALGGETCRRGRNHSGRGGGSMHTQVALHHKHTTAYQGQFSSVQRAVKLRTEEDACAA